MSQKLKAETQARKEAEEKLQAETEARAAMERKVKAEAEKLLVSQYQKYSVQMERAEAQAKEEIAKARAEVELAEEKVRSYSAALVQAQEKLKAIEERIRDEAVARVRAEESLRYERQERERVEAEVREAIEDAKYEAEEKAHSYSLALAQAQEELSEAREQIDKSEPRPTEVLESETHVRRDVYVVPEEQGNAGGPIGRQVFGARNIKRNFFIVLVLAVFSAIALAFSVANYPILAELEGEVTKVRSPAPPAAGAGDVDTGGAVPDAKADSSVGSLSGSSQSRTSTAALNYTSAEEIVLEGDNEPSVPVSDLRTVTIEAYPAGLKITAAAESENSIVKFSDNRRSQGEAGSNAVYEFSDVSIDSKAVIKSAVLFVEHFEEGQFGQGKLEWAVGTGLAANGAVWGTMKAPVHKGQSSEAVDAWDITSFVRTVERINSLQLQVRNKDVDGGRTFVDCAYVTVTYY
jgi:hypothetical protein